MLKKQNIHFIHANGFPPTAYKSLFKNLQEKIKTTNFLLRPLIDNKKNTINEIDSWIPFYQDFIQSIEDKVARLGQGIIYGFDSNFYKTYVKNFKTVTKKDVQTVAQQYFNFDRMVVSVMKPKAKTPEKLPELTKIIDKDLKKTTLSNGVRVLSYYDTSLPKLVAKAFVMGGGVFCCALAKALLIHG